MKAVILAAGRGVRLQPITDEIPKALVPINGQPILEIILKQLKENGITDVIIIVHHLKDTIIERIGDGRDNDMTITYVEQPTMNGTADAVLRAEPHINERFLCIACDSLFETDLISRLQKHNADGVFTCKEVEDGRRYGILVTEGSKVLNIIEKPENPPTNLANFSVYLLPPEIFNACRQCEPRKNNELYLPEAIQHLIDKGMTFEYEISEYIIDIGTKEQLEEAQALAKKLNLSPSNS